MLKWKENRTSFRFLLEKSQQSCVKSPVDKMPWGGGIMNLENRKAVVCDEVQGKQK